MTYPRYTFSSCLTHWGARLYLIERTKIKKQICQRWDLNPRQYSLTRTHIVISLYCKTWVWRLGPLGHTDVLLIRKDKFGKCFKETALFECVPFWLVHELLYVGVSNRLDRKLRSDRFLTIKYGSVHGILYETFGLGLMNLPEDPAFSTGGRHIFKCK
jgi:hypothetical protein